MTTHQNKRYKIENTNGIIVELSELGATITNVCIPKNSIIYDVVLGFGDDDEYINFPEYYFGGIIGRVANRIAGGTFNIEGEVYRTEKNEGNNTLHSGSDGYQLRRWEVVAKASNSITLKHISPHLDQGFPGELKLFVIYLITDDNALEITYHGESDMLSMFNPTNHSYFNLNGHASGSVMNHELWIDSNHYSELNEENIPTGKTLSVENTEMDFRYLKAIGDNKSTGYDDNYILNHNHEKKVATLIGDQTGIKMDVYTDMPCIQLYTGNGLENVPGKEGTIYNQFSGVCLETQFTPNSVNTDNLPLIDGVKVYKTVYQFSDF